MDIVCTVDRFDGSGPYIFFHEWRGLRGQQGGHLLFGFAKSFFLVVLPTKIESWSLPKCWKAWNRNNRCNVTTFVQRCCFWQVCFFFQQILIYSLVFGLCVPEDSEEREVPIKKTIVSRHYMKNQEWSRAHSEKWNILKLGTPGTLVVPKLFRGDKKRSVRKTSHQNLAWTVGWWTTFQFFPTWDVFSG